MKRFLIVALALCAAALLYSQQRTHLPYDFRAVFPHETSPGFYKQVEERELAALADDGWELVSVTPYIYRNEERGSNNPKAVVTQTYPAYFFKRAKMIH